eukprot:XP_013997582.1 PREDICTED: uncharacterized protein LOC106570102 [Salmo salar]
MAARFQVKDHHQSQTPWHSPHPWKPPWELSLWPSTSMLAVEMPRPSARKLTNLIKAELSNIAVKGGPEGDDLMTMLDQDGALNFMEYLTLIVSLACMCNCVLEGKMFLHFMKRPACFHLLSTVYCIRPTCHTNVSYLIE